MEFLQLPREIRQEILALAICSPVTPPATVSEGQRDRQHSSGGTWQLPLQTSTALPLLLVNKQINAEARDVLQHAPAAYHIDIMYLKERGLWTTWSIPALPRTQYIESIHATFRPFEPARELDSCAENSLDSLGAEGGPPVGIWSFYQLLMQLFRAGPGYLDSSRKGSASHYVVRKIVVDVLPPTDGVEHKSIMINNEAYARAISRNSFFANHDNSAFPPERRLAKLMCGYLNILLGFSYQTIDFGSEVLENVQESIEFLVNGKPFQTFDIDAQASHLSVEYFGRTPESVAERKKKYNLWKSWLDERRQRMKNGLELYDNRPVGSIMQSSGVRYLEI